MGRGHEIIFPYFKRYLVKDIPPEFVVGLVAEFSAGNYSRKEVFIQTYARYIAVIGFKAAGEEGISVALETLCMIPEEIASGRLEDGNLVGYTINRVRTRCKNFKRSNFICRIPTTTAWRNGLRLQQVRSLPGNRHKMLDGDDRSGDLNTALLDNLVAHSSSGADRLFEDILDHTNTNFEYLVIELRAESNTDEEIALLIGCSRSKVRDARNRVEERWIESCKVSNS